jgi:hypothetical protein
MLSGRKRLRVQPANHAIEGLIRENLGSVVIAAVGAHVSSPDV